MCKHNGRDHVVANAARVSKHNDHLTNVMLDGQKHQARASCLHFLAQSIDVFDPNLDKGVRYQKRQDTLRKSRVLIVNEKVFPPIRMVITVI